MNWDITKEESKIINEIAERAVTIANGLKLLETRQDEAAFKRTTLMDITATHANGCRLKLNELLHAPAYDFTHDIFGIRKHIDRKTGALQNCFLPRYSARV